MVLENVDERELLFYMERYPQYYKAMQSTPMMRVIQFLQNGPLGIGRLRFKLSLYTMDQFNQLLRDMLSEKIIQKNDESGIEMYSLTDLSQTFLQKYLKSRGRLSF